MLDDLRAMIKGRVELTRHEQPFDGDAWRARTGGRRCGSPGSPRWRSRSSRWSHSGDVIGRYFFPGAVRLHRRADRDGDGVLVYFGVGLVTHEDAHISADFVTSRLPPRCARCLAW
jgi:hypothetical protein